MRNNGHKSPGTCTSCMGRGTQSETKRNTTWKIDEKGLPFSETTTSTSIVPCKGCGGRGTR